MVFTCFLKSLGAKNTVNTAFFTPRKPKTTVFTVFLAPGSQNHSIYSVLWPAPTVAKTVVFTQFSACCKKYFFHATSTKTL